MRDFRILRRVGGAVHEKWARFAGIFAGNSSPDPLAKQSRPSKRRASVKTPQRAFSGASPWRLALTMRLPASFQRQWRSYFPASVKCRWPWRREKIGGGGSIPVRDRRRRLRRLKSLRLRRWDEPWAVADQVPGAALCFDRLDRGRGFSRSAGQALGTAAGCQRASCRL
jgi:hypothetical protein